MNEIAELDRVLEALRAKVGEEALQAALRAKVSMGARSIGTGGDVKGSLLNTGSIEVNVYRGPPAKNPKEALTIYRKVVVASCCDVPLHAIDPSSGDASSPAHKLDLASIYQDLDTKTHVKDKHVRTRTLEEARALRAIEAVATTPRLVLLGDPGSGKSTFVSHLARCLAASALEPKAGWLKRLGWPNAKGPLPILIILRDFARWMPNDADASEPNLVRRFLAARLQAQGLGFAEEPILRSLDDGTAMVLFDGLDEVPSREQRAEVRKAVEAFLKRHETCRALITCRVLSYEEREAQLLGVPSFTLAPFDDEKIQAFIRAWYEELGRRNVVVRGDVNELAHQLTEAIQKKPDLQRLAPNPLLLTVMALLHANRGRLPDARALLYEETVDLLLWHREAHKTRRLRALLDEAELAEVDLKQVLWRLAFEAHQATVQQEGKKQERDRDRDAVAGIAEATLEKALYTIHPTKDRNWAHDMVEAMKIRAGLLVERAPEVYTFPHRTFQEYLAGVYLSNQPGFATKAAELLGEGPLWREVVLLSVGRLVHDGDTDRPLALTAELCPERPREDKAGWANAGFAGEVLIEMGTHRAEQSQLGQDLVERVRGRLLGIMTGEAPSAAERARAGEVLGRLGDPRFEQEMWYLPKEGLGFMEIPAGTFWMGEGRSQHEVWVERCFMARYPVTVEQFVAYVKERGRAPRGMDSLRGSPNHPVVWVSWGEAMGYAEWLTERLKESPRTPEPLKTLLAKGDEQGRRWCVTLPSEAEWEKASRGGVDKRTYPWGDEADPNRANVGATGIGGTSAVGCFAEGKSPYGCEEMSGNVWEWTRNLWYKKGVDEAFGYPYDAKDGRESIRDLPDKSRVVRGGSFIDAMNFARCVFRNLDHLIDWDDGFRVVVSPIPEEA